LSKEAVPNFRFWDKVKTKGILKPDYAPPYYQVGLYTPEMAGHIVALPHRIQGRLGAKTDSLSPGTAGMETAALRRSGLGGNVPLQDDPLHPVPGDGGEQRPGVRMPGLLKDIPVASGFHQFSQVHHPYPV
jgi:hypothetical protein